jgi:hypothetical protein
MRKIEVSNGDTVGIAVQQSDLPMIQFLLNGEPLPDLIVNRFRGNVYPSVYLPDNDGLVVSMVVSSLTIGQRCETRLFSNECDDCTFVSSRKAILSNCHHMYGLVRSLSHKA